MRLEAHNVVRTMHDRSRSFELTIEALALEPGDRKAIIGPSGSGKTTALDILALASAPDHAGRFLLRDDRGAVAFDVAQLHRERRVEALTRIRRRHFGYALQSANLFPFLCVGENVLLTQRMTGQTDRERARRLLGQLDIGNLWRAMPADLSVGQKQRVAIARALAHRPSFLIADEPTSSLDPQTAGAAIAVISAEMAEIGGASLIVTHDAAFAAQAGFTLIAVACLATNANADPFRCAIRETCTP